MTCWRVRRRCAGLSDLHWVWLNKAGNLWMQSRSKGLEERVFLKWLRIGTVTRFDVFIRVKFTGAVYVLHTFQKKSKTGRKTPKQEIDLVLGWLKAAEEHYRQWRQGKEQ